MSDANVILCDGCGQPASPEHTAKRLLRLEWATRYRPIHLHTLLLGAASPERQSDFLYSPDNVHEGEGAYIFSAAGIAATDIQTDAPHSEFQRRGLFLAHVLECPLNTDNHEPLAAALAARLPAVFTRIRRSLKPKRLVFISSSHDVFIDQFASAQLGCELVLDDDHPFALDSSTAGPSGVIARLQDVLSVSARR